MTRARLCTVKQHSAELQHSPHIVSNSWKRKQNKSKRHTEFKVDSEAEKWGSKQHCPTLMQLAVSVLPRLAIRNSMYTITRPQPHQTPVLQRYPVILGIRTAFFQDTNLAVVKSFQPGSGLSDCLHYFMSFRKLFQ